MSLLAAIIIAMAADGAQAGEAKDIVVAPDTVCRVENSALKCEPSLQALFECRLPNEAAARERVKGVRAYGLKRNLPTEQTLLKPLMVFDKPINKVVLESDQYTITWSHHSPLNVKQLAKRMGIKGGMYTDSHGTMGLTTFRGMLNITLTSDKTGTLVQCGYNDDTGDY